jgi:hypothetical protein
LYDSIFTTYPEQIVSKDKNQRWSPGSGGAGRTKSADELRVFFGGNDNILEGDRSGHNI